MHPWYDIVKPTGAHGGLMSPRVLEKTPAAKSLGGGDLEGSR